MNEEYQILLRARKRRPIYWLLLKPCQKLNEQSLVAITTVI
jgi:hypothetical protein